MTSEKNDPRIIVAANVAIAILKPEEKKCFVLELYHALIKIS